MQKDLPQIQVGPQIGFKKTNLRASLNLWEVTSLGDVQCNRPIL